MLKLTQTELVLSHAMSSVTMSAAKRETLKDFFFFWQEEMSCTLDKNSAGQLPKKTNFYIKTAIFIQPLRQTYPITDQPYTE